MPIIDERRITFDVGALKAVLLYSHHAVQSLGLPHNEPDEIVMNPAARAATLHFDGTEVMLGSDKLAALIISYCIRAGIKVPRKSTRSVRVDATTVALVFRDDRLITPVPKSAIPDQVRPRSTSWTDAAA